MLRAETIDQRERDFRAGRNDDFGRRLRGCACGRINGAGRRLLNGGRLRVCGAWKLVTVDEYSFSFSATSVLDLSPDGERTMIAR